MTLDPDARALRAQMSEDDHEEERQFLEDLSEDEIFSMLADGVCETADGCSVEPDGICPHGYLSPLILMGVM